MSEDNTLITDMIFSDSHSRRGILAGVTSPAVGVAALLSRSFDEAVFPLWRVQTVDIRTVLAEMKHQSPFQSSTRS